MRANGVPCGFCYQKFPKGKSETHYGLHGLNAVYLHDIGWYKVDARGNKSGVDAAFTPPIERLAFPDGEFLRNDVLAEPLPHVIDTLRRSATLDALAENNSYPTT